MTTKTQTTTEAAEALAAQIAATEAEAAQATQADRDHLAELRAQAHAEEAAEADRQATRRQAWARQYLRTQHTAEAAEARKAVTAARREFERALADAPWVQALMDWQAALNAQHATERRAAHARTLLGQSTSTTGDAANVLPMLDGEVKFGPIGRALHNLAEAVEAADPAAEVDALAAHAGGKGDPLADALDAAPADRHADPLAHLARNGARLEVTHHVVDDHEVVMHRNPLSGEWVKTDAGGSVLATSWATAKAQGKPSNPVDGREHGSQYDADAGKFRPTRLR